MTDQPELERVLDVLFVLDALFVLRAPTNWPMA
jgi:hypothetical protein